MNQKTRIKKLEEKGCSKLLVVMPRFEDANGQVWSAAQLPEDITTATIRSLDLEFTRETDEGPDDFARRVKEDVTKLHKSCVVLDHWAAMI